MDRTPDVLADILRVVGEAGRANDRDVVQGSNGQSHDRPGLMIWGRRERRLRGALFGLAGPAVPQ